VKVTLFLRFEINLACVSGGGNRQYKGGKVVKKTRVVALKYVANMQCSSKDECT
jgi:hypothetical protein